MDREQFKLCPGCRTWLSVDDVMRNEAVRPIGMVLADTDHTRGMFYFQHDVPHCRSSFVIPAAWFLPLIEEPIPSEVKACGDGCERRCTHIDDWAACRNDCHHAPFRRLLIRMLENRKMAVKSY